MTHYLIDKKVFETLAEATKYANTLIVNHNVFINISTTNRKITHIWK